MDLLQELMQEHQVILEFLDVFERMIAQQSSGQDLPTEDFERALVFFENYVDRVHHGKEEKILFPVAFEAQLLKGGGPKCNLFFGMFLQQRFLEKVKAEVTPEDGIDPYVPRPEIDNILKVNDPLSIPLEDHQAGYYCLTLMKHELGSRKQGESWESARFCRVARWYIEMLRWHIRKEDECLFVRLQKQMSRIDGAQIDSEEGSFAQLALKNSAALTGKY